MSTQAEGGEELGRGRERKTPINYSRETKGIFEWAFLFPPPLLHRKNPPCSYPLQQRGRRNHKNNNPDEEDPVINKSEKIESQERRALSVRSYYPGGGTMKQKPTAISQPAAPQKRPRIKVSPKTHTVSPSFFPLVYEHFPL